MINKFIKLGHNINSKWKKSGRQVDSFSQIALEEIKEFEVDLTLEAFEKELATWMCENELPKQVNTYNTFGQPPVTLFNNGRFVIDIYFWMHADTSIHSHSFSGAFRVLFGKSLHEKFSVKPKKVFSNDVMESDVHLIDSSLLEKNDSHEIIRGNLFNHRLIHIDMPTVTLCIRTINDERTSQWHHFPNGLSIHKKEMSEEVIKSLYYWQYLNYRSNNEASLFINNKINNWSISDNLNLYEQLSMDQMGLEDELVEYIFNFIRSKYEGQKWFSLYNKFYNEALEYKEIEREEPIYRLFEHLINNKYSVEKSISILEKVLNRKLNNDEKLYLDN